MILDVGTLLSLEGKYRVPGQDAGQNRHHFLFLFFKLRVAVVT